MVGRAGPWNHVSDIGTDLPGLEAKKLGTMRWRYATYIGERGIGIRHVFPYKIVATRPLPKLLGDFLLGRTLLLLLMLQKTIYYALPSRTLPGGQKHPSTATPPVIAGVKPVSNVSQVGSLGGAHDWYD